MRNAMMKEKHILLWVVGLCACLCASSVRAQKNTTKISQVSGRIVDAFTKEAILSDTVKVSLLRMDSTVLKTLPARIWTSNGRKGCSFSVNLEKQPTDRFILKFEHPDYYTVYRPVRFAWKKRNTVYFQIPEVQMRRKSLKDSRMLSEVAVTATKIKFYLDGDTMVYNADAFQLQEGSMLDALIEQLPGAELKPDGQILVKGRKVESLLLNGRDFFKGDNTVLLDNLPAYMVKEVKTYEKESDESELLGRKVDQGQFVMDVILKRQYSVGWLANTEWGYGSEKRYLGRLFAMRYTPNSRVSLFGNLNNVNDRRKPNGNGVWGNPEPTGGLDATKRGGVNYNIYDKRGRYEASGQADVYYKDNDDSWFGMSTDIMPGGDVYNVERGKRRTSNLKLSTSHYFKYKSHTGTSFSVNPVFEYTDNDSHFNFLNGTFSEKPDKGYVEVLDSLYSPRWTSTLRNVVRRNEQLTKGNTRNTYGALGMWVFFRLSRFNSSGLTFDSNVNFRNEKQKDADLFNYNYFTDNMLQTDFRHRYNRLSSNSLNVWNRAKAILHLTDEWMLNPSYTLDYHYETGDRLRYRLDWLDESQDQGLDWLPSQAEHLLQALDRDNSYGDTYHRFRHEGMLDLQWTRRAKDDKGQSYAAWYLQIKPSLVVNRYIYDFNSYTRPQNVYKTYVLPQLSMQMTRNTPGRRHQLSLNADVITTAPSVTNLVDWTSTANPLAVTLGNPNLDYTTRYKMNFSYRSDRWLQNKQRMLWGGAGFTIDQNRIAMSYTYDKQTGVRTTQPVNINGNWEAQVYAGFNTPLDKAKRLTMYVMPSINYYHTVDMASSQADVDPFRTTTNSVLLTQQLQFNYRYKKMNVGLHGLLYYTHAVADRDDYERINTWAFRYGPNVVIDLPWNLQLSTEFTIHSRFGYENREMNTNDLVWNARLSKSVLNNRLFFMVDAWDILGNLSNTTIGANSQRRWEYYTNVIPRYVIFRIGYRFDKQPKKNR